MPKIYTLSLSLSQAKKHLSPADRIAVCQSMCHDVSTANRFYTDMPGIDEVFRIRDLRSQALQTSADLLDECNGQDESSDCSIDLDTENE